MIVFTGDTYHAGIGSIERSNGSYPSILRIFSYIVEDDYITDDENIIIIKQSQLFKHNCQICTNINMEELHYTNQVIKYDMSKYEIESLKEGTILMDDLQKVGWVVLKSGIIIKLRSPLEDALYDLNNDVSSDKSHWFGLDNNKRQMYYKQSLNNHDKRFLRKTLIVELHDILKKILSSYQ